jgi:hypothetical protein
MCSVTGAKLNASTPLTLVTSPIGSTGYGFLVAFSCN